MSTRSGTSSIGADAARVHREATIVDGLVFMSDGYTADLKEGNVAAINFIGDGCLETENSGLSLFGRRVVREMNKVGVAIDLSHVGERTSFQTVETSEKPVFLTHANAHAVVAMPRNKTDALIKAVAATG